MTRESPFGRIALLIPCHNEEAAIAKVISDFRGELPAADIYVYDNNSTDRTAEIAKQAGAIVRKEKFQGKGNVVRRMFADIEADTYIMVDGDGTYDAASLPRMLESYGEEQADMVNGARLSAEEETYRPGHRFGNWLLTSLVAVIFGRSFKDMLSGYRIFSRRFVKSFPAFAGGFEIETELTVHALELRMATSEVDTPYFVRAEGSESKLNTIQDGFRILFTIANLVKQERPLQFFSSVFALLTVIAVVLTVPIFENFLETGLVDRIPTAILATGIMILAFLSLASGFILETVTRGRQESKRMRYLSVPGPQALHEPDLDGENDHASDK